MEEVGHTAGWVTEMAAPPEALEEPQDDCPPDPSPSMFTWGLIVTLRGPGQQTLAHKPYRALAHKPLQGPSPQNPTGP